MLNGSGHATTLPVASNAPDDIDSASRRLARRRRRRRRLVVILGAWAALLAFSNVWQARSAGKPPGAAPAGATREISVVPEQTATGERAGRTASISALRWAPAEGGAKAGAPPVILLHGSPGSAGDFATFARILAGAGRETFALDLPGYGDSERYVGDYSLGADARTVLAWMDARGIARAHIVGWSLGGGVGVRMASLAPERIASLTMLASIGAQEAEGSGNYTFEHVKYGLGFALVVALPEALPHFGLLGDRAHRLAFIRSFWDSDQRPMRAMMERLTTPTLVLHGRRDILVPAWGAELHHSLIPGSRLVMLDANHFLPMRAPFGQAPLTAEHLLPFLARHDAPGATPLAGAADFAPMPARGAGVGRIRFTHAMHWWLLALAIIAGTFITEDGTVIAVGLAIAHGQIDLGIGVIGCFVGIAAGDGGLYMIGRVFGRRALRWPALRRVISEQSLERWGRVFDRHTALAVFLARMIPGTRVPTYLAAGILAQRSRGFLLWAGIAAFVWTPFVLAVVIAFGPGVFEAVRSVFAGPVAILVSILTLLVAVRIFTYAFTWEGRRRLLRDALLPFNPEFWPMWLYYLPLVPWIGWLALRRGGHMTFTCLNPGIAHGGGIVGESKIAILSKLDDVAEFICPTAVIGEDESAEARAEKVDRILRDDAAFGGYPVVLKPDEAQRGHGFKVVRSRADAAAYFKDMTRAALLQRFHPGPHEVGILWTRDAADPGAERGRIFSITRKQFPVITGDGKTALDRLILRHPRFRMQADVFLKRFDALRDLVLEAGQTMSLAVAGNHCQGTKFMDGADLITPELERVIDRIALSFDRGGLDFGRFDVRFATEDDLRAGRNFSIIELNGTMSESTNMYDPGRSIFWMYGVLFRQWRVMFELGSWRRRSGAKPMRPRELLAAARDHFRGRPGSSVSD